MKTFNSLAYRDTAQVLLSAHAAAPSEVARNRQRDALMAHYVSAPAADSEILFGFMSREYDLFARRCTLFRYRPLDNQGNMVGCDGVTRRREIHNCLQLLSEIKPAQASICIDPLFGTSFDDEGVYMAKNRRGTNMLTPQGQAMLTFLDRAYGPSLIVDMKAKGLANKTLADNYVFTVVAPGSARTAKPALSVEQKLA